MVKVYTSTIRKHKNNYRALDVTIKSQSRIGTLFAPTWNMVWDYKNKVISEEQYTNLYLDHMRQSYKLNKDVWDKILSRNEIIFLCYCHKGNFCHRILLAKIFKKLGGTYEGEI